MLHVNLWHVWNNHRHVVTSSAFTSNHPCLGHCAEHADDHYSVPQPLVQLQAIIRKLNITAHDPVQSVIVPC